MKSFALNYHLFICLLALLKKPHGQTSPNFVCMLLVALTRSSSIVICHILPVLWMALFPTNGPMAPSCAFLSHNKICQA